MSKKKFMQKCAIAAATGLVSLMLAVPAFADTPAAAPNAAPSPDRQKVEADHKAEEAQRFSDHKQEMLKSISDRIAESQERIAEMQKKQACIQAATDGQTMHACFPDNGRGKPGGEHRGEGKWEHHGDHQGAGQQQQPSPAAPTAQH